MKIKLHVLERNEINSSCYFISVIYIARENKVEKMYYKRSQKKGTEDAKHDVKIYSPEISIFYICVRQRHRAVFGLA